MLNGGPSLWENSVDVRLELGVNHFVGHASWFDKLVVAWDGTNLATTVVIVLLIWLAVFDWRRPGKLRSSHELVFGSLVFGMAATLAARAIALSLPFRARPMADPHLAFRLPAGGELGLIHWSAFPSDHAALFMALAVGILPVSRRLGWLAIAWTTFFICFPRLYLGVHWPTDLLAGVLIGGVFAQGARIPAFRRFVRNTIERFHNERPALFLALFFVWSYETSILFEDVRRVLFVVAHHFSTHHI